ncbi:MAG: Eco57I restriction-modification methylase domain-containing protein [Pseudonocardiaceae bacterium]
MDKQTRNAIDNATQRARRLLEEDFAAQLEGDFDVLRSGAVADVAGGHLTPRQVFHREKIVATLNHKCAAGMTVAEAVADYIRDAAFTTLNRFAALKMLEARGLVLQCVSKGEASAGYSEFCGLAPSLPLLPHSAGYRLYIESLFDELSTEVKVLFDRRDPASVLWPRRAAFDELLDILNAPGLAGIWGEDETIGWFYQYFNSGDERRKMRESQVPRNSRELAIRNQFFTPRYVVEFLTDNTLGRIWYEMRETKTALADQCEYIVRRPDEEFAPRPKKDPRDIRVLDPACGSGHFLLYAFDLLITMYEEAHADPESPASEATGRTLAEDYPSLDELRRAIPGLVLAHNLYGVDIDPRCAQIAQLALWIRTQRAYRDFGIRRDQRPQIRRSNIVIAEPLVADGRVAADFLARLDDDELKQVFKDLVDVLALAGDLGLLLRLESRGTRPLARGYEWDLFTPTDDRLRGALVRFAADESGAANMRRRLFVNDAMHGMGLIALASRKYDAVLMNPPFGDFASDVQQFAKEQYSHGRNDIYTAMVLRGRELLLDSGRIGVITSSSFMLGRDHRRFRQAILNLSGPRVSLLLNLGCGVLDQAMVETTAYVLMSNVENIAITSVASVKEIEAATKDACRRWSTWRIFAHSYFAAMPMMQFIYGIDVEVGSQLDDRTISLDPSFGRVTKGLSTPDNFRYIRLRWELAPDALELGWQLCAKGGEYAWFSGDLHLLVNRVASGKEMAASSEPAGGNVARTRQSSTYYGRAAVTWSRRSQKGFSVRRLRKGACFLDKSGVIVPKEEGEEDLLPAIMAALATNKYQSLIRVQSRFGAYETGMVGLLPAPAALLQASCDWGMIAEVVDEFESHFETNQIFSSPPPPNWNPVVSLDSAFNTLADNLQSCGYELDETVRRNEVSRLEALREQYGYQNAWLSFLFGVAIGRWDKRLLSGDRTLRRRPGLFDDLGICAPAENVHDAAGPPVSNTGVVTDDDGTPDNVLASVVRAAETVLEAGLAGPLFLDVPQLRRWFATEFFDYHLRRYSRSRRSAPVYWQLATSSASYSVWLYIQAFTRDTLFRVQNDYVVPKLEHEQRRLETMLREFGERTTAAERRGLADQEAFVGELRDFLDEVKRVAPLWNPNLDDGVIVNFAPLWRLVPQHKPWQRELKATWDALCEGTYDWAHLAMHLWPERVVPECVVDRSLAIAHDLEEVFWVQGDDGKWSARLAPTVPVEQLVRERTSTAVKSALRSVLTAPITNGRGRRRRGAPGTGNGGGR